MSTPEFQQHVVALRKHIHWYALSLTQDRDRAADLTQDCMLRALQHQGQFREDTNLKAWLTTIARNTFINGHRWEKRTTALLAKVGRDQLRQTLAATTASTESTLLKGELNGALARLDRIFRLPFEMHHHGFKYQEIADELAIPVGTVKSRIHQARQRLADMLRDTPTANAAA